MDGQKKDGWQHSSKSWWHCLAVQSAKNQ